MLVSRLVLSERTVAFEKFIEHTAKTKPIGRRVVGRALGQDLRSHVAVGADRGMGLLFAKVTSEAQVGYADVSMLVEEYVGGFEITVNNEATVHVLQTEDDLGSIEFHLQLVEDAMLREVVVKVAAVHEVENEAEFVGCVEGVGHAHDEGTVLTSTDKAKHYPLIES